MSKKADAPATFSLGCLVRVRSGTKDPDFPDIPIGGWAGKITKVEAVNPPCYLIRWNHQTLNTLNRFEDDHWCDEMYGLLCKVESGRGIIEVPLAELEKVKGKPNAQILDDYKYWICNHQ